MAPFDPNSLAGILGMQQAMQGQAAPLGMKPMIETAATPGFVGVNGKGMTGAELPGMEGLDKIPGHTAMMGAAGAGDGAGLALDQNTMGPMAAILGLTALQQLGGGSGPQQQLPTLSTGAAPRGQQIQLSKGKERLPVNGASRGGMASALYGGK